MGCVPFLWNVRGVLIMWDDRVLTEAVVLVGAFMVSVRFAIMMEVNDGHWECMDPIDVEKVFVG